MPKKEKIILEIQDLYKSYDGKKVLDGFDCRIRKGEIHAVFGEQDSGKTTLIKIIAGLAKKDRGNILFNDKEVEIHSLREAKELSLGFVHQQLGIFPDLSILDNIFLNHDYPRNRFGSISIDKMLQQVKTIPKAFSLDLDYRQPAGDLTNLEMWKIMVSRALVVKSKILFVDELSSSLGFEDLKELFNCLRKLKKDGTTIVYVTNKMSEIFEIADRLTILKDGKRVGTTDVRETDNWALFRMMVDREHHDPPKNKQEAAKPDQSYHFETIDIDKTLEGVEFDGIVGGSRELKQVLSEVIHVADTDASVLITGETGVGKELIARAIHMHSRRLDKAFISVHCSALSETLLTSELFGHEKGAFTGANERRIGRFELAHEGTLFLDEIGEFSRDIQVRLLRILQTKEFERVGGNESIRSDFRLIAATNRDLQEEVMKKRFRQDLFYRLNVVPIYVPPLRERKEDIASLVDHFISMHSARIGKNVKTIRAEDIERLKQYHWPGNIRELENIIERATILSRGETLRLPEFRQQGAESADQGDGLTMNAMERKHILWALEQTGWKIRGPGGAAELLDMNYSTLRGRMRKHNIQREN